MVSTFTGSLIIEEEDEIEGLSPVQNRIQSLKIVKLHCRAFWVEFDVQLPLFLSYIILQIPCDQSALSAFWTTARNS